MRLGIRQAIQRANEQVARNPLEPDDPLRMEKKRRKMAVRAQTLVREMVRSGVTLHEAMPIFREGYMQAALDLEQGNKSAAARRIGLHRNTWYHQR